MTLLAKFGQKTFGKYIERRFKKIKILDDEVMQKLEVNYGYLLLLQYNFFRKDSK